MTSRFALPLAFAIAVLGQEAGEAGRRDILTLMDVSGAVNNMAQIFRRETVEAQMREMIVKNAPPAKQQEAEQFAVEFAKEFAEEAPKHFDELKAKLVAIYEKHLSPDDVKQLIAFYKTPIGQKMVGLTPKIAFESLQLGQAWGMELGKQIGERVGKRLNERKQ